MDDACPLSALNHDCVAHVLSFLDVHCVAYTLPCVSRSLQAAAHDPVVWANIIVEPCSDGELLWMAEQHVTIRHIAYTPTTSSPRRIYSTVLGLCPRLIYWPGLCGAFPDHTQQLVHATLDPPVAVTSIDWGSSLRVLEYYDEEGPSLLDTLSELCPNVRRLRCVSFLKSNPRAFPELRELSSVSNVIGVGPWTEFAESHSHLHSLELVGTVCEVEADYFEVFPTSLTALTLSETFGYATGLGLKLIARNTSLRCLHVHLMARNDTFEALSACTRLRTLTLSGIHSSVDSDCVYSFVEAVESLAEFNILLPIGVEMEALLVRSLGYIRKTGSWFMNDNCIPELATRLRTVTHLDLVVLAPSVDSMAILGREITHLKRLTLNVTPNYTKAHCSALARALGRLETLELRAARLCAGPLVAGAASSTVLRDLSIESVPDKLFVPELLLIQFLDGWCGRPLYRLTLGEMDALSLPKFLSLADDGELCAFFPEIKFRGVVSQVELEQLHSRLRPCGRRRDGGSGGEAVGGERIAAELEAFGLL